VLALQQHIPYSAALDWSYFPPYPAIKYGDHLKLSSAQPAAIAKVRIPQLVAEFLVNRALGIRAMRPTSDMSIPQSFPSEQDNSCTVELGDGRR